MRQGTRASVLWAMLPFALLLGESSCGSSDDPGGRAEGASCTSSSECNSGSCEDGICVSEDPGVTGVDDSSTGSSGVDPGEGDATGTSPAGSVGDGTGTAPAGSDCTDGDQCASGACVDGVCATSTGSSSDSPIPVSGSSTATVTVAVGPHFAGSGDGWRPLTTGCGPDTADLCTGECERAGGDPGVSVVRPPATLCFSGEGDLTPEDPSVVIEQVIEELDGLKYVHLRVTFDPAFTDNTYGTGACCGWPEKRGHTFEDLSKSDHTELLLTNGESETVMNFKMDLVTEDASSECGFGSLGVSGGDGSMIQGDPAHVLAVATSLDRNLNGCGYCQDDACGGDCTVNSPATDEGYSTNPDAPNWDYRQVYETWVDMAAFGSSGFGQAFITYTHSSPSKGSDTILVEPEPCPPDWDSPYCPPNVPECMGSGGSGGDGSGGGGGLEGGTGGSGAVGGGDAPCPPNEQIYVNPDGTAVCTPIPFANYPGMAACPDGWVIDVASEGRYCLPE